MIRRPPRSTRTDTRFPYTTLFRSDRREKRGLIRNAIVVVLFGSAAIALLSWPSVRARLTPHEWLFGAYGLISLVGFARGFYSPAVSSLRPFLVPREIYGNSATWASTFFQTGAIAGPVSAGELGRAPVCTPVTNAQ